MKSVKSVVHEWNMQENVIERLKHLIADELGANIKFADIDETASLFEDGVGLDSIMTVEFITLIEDHFGVQFAEAELNMDAFQNLQTLAQAIEAKLAEKNAP